MRQLKPRQKAQVKAAMYPATEGFESIQALGPVLEPVYIKRLPTRDSWGEPFHALSVFNEGYALVSYGSDHTPEHAYDTWGWENWASIEPTQTIEPGRELIFVNGHFVQWPLPMLP
jgi:hypothetical protein